MKILKTSFVRKEWNVLRVRSPFRLLLPDFLKKWLYSKSGLKREKKS